MGGTAKAYGLTPDHVLNEMSFANMTLYNAVIPEYRSPRKDGKGRGSPGGEHIRADDPGQRERAAEAIARMV